MWDHVFQEHDRFSKALQDVMERQALLSSPEPDDPQDAEAALGRAS